MIGKARMNNLHYINYTADQLAEDENFWRWVLRESNSMDAFWTEFCEKYPEKKKDVEEARQRVHELNTPTHVLPESSVRSIWERVQEDIGTDNQEAEKDALQVNRE